MPIIRAAKVMPEATPSQNSLFIFVSIMFIQSVHSKVSQAFSVEVSQGCLHSICVPINPKNILEPLGYIEHANSVIDHDATPSASIISTTQASTVSFSTAALSAAALAAAVSR